MSLTVLEEYIETGNFQDLDLLLSRDPSLVNQNTSHDISPLLLACYYHKDKIVHTILKYITRITIHEACATGLADQVRTMLEQKPEVANELSNHGFTPLGIAAHFNKEDIVRILLQHHADPNISSQNGYSSYPLHAALNNNNDNISKMLIEAGAEVNIVQNGRISPLHLAAQHGNIDLIIVLLEQGADVSARTEYNLTAADLASEKGFHEIADILRVV